MYFSFKFCIPTGVSITYVQIFFSDFFKLKSIFPKTYIETVKAKMTRMDGHAWYNFVFSNIVVANRNQFKT
jgi:hypothetical protein